MSFFVATGYLVKLNCPFALEGGVFGDVGASICGKGSIWFA